jgi:hypothetical protein
MKKRHEKRGADDYVRDGGSVGDAPRDSYEPAGDAKMNLKLRQVAKILEEVVAGADPGDIADAFRRVVEILHGADRLTIWIAKGMCALKAKIAKLSKPARHVDELFRELESEPGPAASPSKLGALLTDPEPWPEPVGAEVFDEVREVITKYVVVPVGADVLVTLWAALSYLISSPALDISPILTIVSPTKRCGKSTLLTVLGALALKALPVSSISPAALYRAVEAFQPTLVIDEMDTFLPGNDELRGIVNGSHIRSMAFVVRTNVDTMEPELYSTWASKCVAMIGDPPPTIADRSIIITLRRRTRSENVSRLPLARIHGDLADLRRRLARWSLDHEADFAAADPVLPEELGNDRALDNVRPLLQIATAAGSGWPERAQAAVKAVYLGDQAPGDSEEGVELLTDIRDLLKVSEVYGRIVGCNAKGTAVMVIPGGLHEALIGLDHRPWKSLERGSPISVYSLGRVLSDFRVWRRSFRIGGGTVINGYSLKALREAFERYLPVEGGENPLPGVQDNDSDDFDEKDEPVTNGVYRDAENRANARRENDVTDVTGSGASPEGDTRAF